MNSNNTTPEAVLTPESDRYFNTEIPLFLTEHEIELLRSSLLLREVDMSLRGEFPELVKACRELYDKLQTFIK